MHPCIMHRRASVLTGRLFSNCGIFSTFNWPPSVMHHAMRLLCGRLFSCIPSLTYHDSIRFFVSLDGVQTNVIRYLHLFFTLQPILLQPIYPACQPKLRIYLDCTYHADTAYHMTPDLCQSRTFQHSKSGCYPGESMLLCDFKS